MCVHARRPILIEQWGGGGSVALETNLVRTYCLRVPVNRHCCCCCRATNVGRISPWRLVPSKTKASHNKCPLPWFLLIRYTGTCKAISSFALFQFILHLSVLQKGEESICSSANLSRFWKRTAGDLFIFLVENSGHSGSSTCLPNLLWACANPKE